ncbi:MAG: alkaline phosphatase family protein [Candidatus Nanohaloarchaea archaeon]
MTSNTVLVVAFDGLDKELIEEFGLENIPQKEFGVIDNNTLISERKTSELFASFITGENYKEHSIEGVGGWTNERIESLENALDGIKFFDKFKGLRSAVYESVNFFDAQKTYPKKEDLEIETIFDKVDDSRALFVPSYNPGSLWLVGPWQMMNHGFTPEEVCEEWDGRSYEHRKRKLWSELQNDIVSPRNLLMCHFHRADVYQHIYSFENQANRAKLRKVYIELDQFAGRIKDLALEQGYDTVIFMSDHGLPIEKSHNKNAFYSSNKELFGDEIPHITDFHDKILELIKFSESKETCEVYSE